MFHWLIVFRRSAGELLRFERYEDSGEALGERFRLEREPGGCDPDLEIVVLGADSADTLRVTHSRYFARSDAAFAEMVRLGQEIDGSPVSPQN